MFPTPDLENLLSCTLGVSASTHLIQLIDLKTPKCTGQEVLQDQGWEPVGHQAQFLIVWKENPQPHRTSWTSTIGKGTAHTPRSRRDCTTHRLSVQLMTEAHLFPSTVCSSDTFVLNVFLTWFLTYCLYLIFYSNRTCSERLLMTKLLNLSVEDFRCKKMTLAWEDISNICKFNDYFFLFDVFKQIWDYY